MAFLGQTYSADELPQSDRSFDLIPEGWYNAKITKADLKDTKNGTGKKIDIRYDILGPTQQGRVIFGSINIANQNPTAEKIGQQQLGEHMRAIGLARVEDTDQLIGGELQIRIKIKQPSDSDKANGYNDPKNEISGVKSVGGAASYAPAAFANAPAPLVADRPKAPWEK
jgi:hypothetical protein